MVISSETFQQSIDNLHLNKIKYHLFICADQTVPKCCNKEDSIIAWNYLKQRIKELGLEQITETNPSCVFRTKANCLRVCHSGPILLVYPDRVWYHSATPPIIERILQEHIIQGKIVQENAFLIGDNPD